MHMMRPAHKPRPQRRSWSKHMGSDRWGSPHRTQKSHAGRTWCASAGAEAEASKNESPVKAQHIW